MIKTLRITIILTAVIAVFFFVISAAFGLRHDKEKESFLAKPTATEIFKKNASRSAGQLESPLLKQAQSFALRINPPKPVEPATPIEIHKVVEVPKFKLLGTSFLAQDPNKSMALIDEPRKGTHWVSASDTIDYLSIVRIEDGKVFYTDGKKTMEMVTDKPPETPGIVVNSGPDIEAKKPAPLVSNQPQQSLQQLQQEPQEQPTPPEQQQPTAESEAQSNIDFIKQLMNEANDPNRVQGEHGISVQEANDLQGLGEFLKRLEEEQKQNEANGVQPEPDK